MDAPEIGDPPTLSRRARGWSPWLVHSLDRLNLLRVITALPIVLIPAVLHLSSDLTGVAIGLIVFFLLNDINFLLHQHVHCPLSPRRWFNEALDVWLGPVTGMTASCWRQHHLLRHHLMNDTWAEGREWELRRRTPVGAISYSVRGAPIVILRPYWESIVRGLVHNERTPIRFCQAFVLQTVNFAIIGVLVWRAAWFYVPYYALIWIFSRRTDYDNHVGCDETPFGFANNALDPRYNWIRNNFGYHTAHHLHPGAHWSQLPRLHEEIAAHIPQERFARMRWSRALNPGAVAYLFRRHTPAVGDGGPDHLTAPPFR